MFLCLDRRTIMGSWVKNCALKIINILWICVIVNKFLLSWDLNNIGNWRAYRVLHGRDTSPGSSSYYHIWTVQSSKNYHSGLAYFSSPSNGMGRTVTRTMIAGFCGGNNCVVEFLNVYSLFVDSGAPWPKAHTTLINSRCLTHTIMYTSTLWQPSISISFRSLFLWVRVLLDFFFYKSLRIKFDLPERGGWQKDYPAENETQ